MPSLTFSERLRRRNRLWWDAGQKLPRVSLHRFLDRVQLRSRHTPVEDWRCCGRWQRCLLNKWNSREFAALHGVAVPELYWHGRDAAQLPAEDLPEHFVIRPAWGERTKGAWVVSGNTDLVSGRRYANRAELKAAVIAGRGRFGLFPLLAEEFMTTPEGKHEAGLEYKFHMFGGHTGPIMTFIRRGETKWLRHYTPEWDLIDEVFHTSCPLDEIAVKPEQLDEMNSIATRLGAAFGTFVRVDLYLTSSGIFFGEYSSVPGGYKDYTPFADDYLGRLWEKHIPGEV
jgi:hypothetical protein